MIKYTRDVMLRSIEAENLPNELPLMALIEEGNCKWGEKNIRTYKKTRTKEKELKLIKKKYLHMVQSKQTVTHFISSLSLLCFFFVSFAFA